MPDVHEDICRHDPTSAQAALRALVDHITESMQAAAERHTRFALVYNKP